jgi:hypothetical protein
VFIDEEQLAWFEATLQRCGSRPVVVFTHVRTAASSANLTRNTCLRTPATKRSPHPKLLKAPAFPVQAPPMGSGLQVVQEVRLSCRPLLIKLQYSLLSGYRPMGQSPGRRLTDSTTASPAGARQEPVRMAESQQQPRIIHSAGGALFQHPPLVLRGVQPVMWFYSIEAVICYCF